MAKNMGAMDRLLRFVLAGGVAGLYLAGALSGLATAILGVVALIFVATSTMGTCPLYVPFGLSTRGSQESTT